MGEPRAIMGGEMIMNGPMKVCCIGAGYVGGSTMAMMALKCQNLTVTCLDINQARVDAWNSEELPIYEPGLLEIVQEVRGTRLFFKGMAEYDQVVAESDMIFVCVPTPTKKHGVGKGKAADLAYWEKAARGIAPALMREDNKLRVVVEKSTVPVHTADAVAAVLKAEGVSNVEVLSNPEFLAEGTAIKDLTSPDRVLIGGSSSPSGAQAGEHCAEWTQHDWILCDDQSRCWLQCTSNGSPKTECAVR